MKKQISQKAQCKTMDLSLYRGIKMINILFDKEFRKVIVTAILIYCGLC